MEFIALWHYSERKLFVKSSELTKRLKLTEHKNKLLSGNLDFDYLDTLYRSKLKFGLKNEIVIKLK